MIAIDAAATLSAGLFISLLLSRRAEGWHTAVGASVNTLLAFTFAWLALRTWGAFA